MNINRICLNIHRNRTHCVQTLTPSQILQYWSKGLTRGMRLFGCVEIIDKHTKLRTRTFNNEIEFTIIFVLFANTHTHTHTHT